MNTIEVRPTLIRATVGAYPHLFIDGQAIATVDVEQVQDVLRERGYIVIDPKRLPEVTVDGNGKPKLPSTEQSVRDMQNMTAGSRYRLEAYGKLALAAWYDARDAARKALRADLERDLGEQGVEFSDRVADKLVRAGWHK